MAFEFSDSHSRYPKQQMVNEAIVGVTPCPTTRIPERSELPQVAMIAATADPRYRKAIAVYGLYTGKSFAEVIRLAILTLGAILLPAGFLVRLIRNRHWLLGTDKRGGGREHVATDVFAEGDPGLSHFATRKGPTASGELMVAEQQQKLRQLLSQLSPDQRQVIELRHFEELPFSAIAARLGRSDPAVRMLWVRGIQFATRVQGRYAFVVK